MSVNLKIRTEDASMIYFYIVELLTYHEKFNFILFLDSDFFRFFTLSKIYRFRLAFFLLFLVIHLTHEAKDYYSNDHHFCPIFRF